MKYLIGNRARRLIIEDEMGNLAIGDRVRVLDCMKPTLEWTVLEETETEPLEVYKEIEKVVVEEDGEEIAE